MTVKLGVLLNGRTQTEQDPKGNIGPKNDENYTRNAGTSK